MVDGKVAHISHLGELDDGGMCVYDVWCMMYDVWCMMYDVWCLMNDVYDVWCMMYDVWCMMYDVWCMMYDRGWRLSAECTVSCSAYAETAEAKCSGNSDHQFGIWLLLFLFIVYHCVLCVVFYIFIIHLACLLFHSSQERETDRHTQRETERQLNRERDRDGQIYICVARVNSERYGCCAMFIMYMYVCMYVNTYILLMFIYIYQIIYHITYHIIKAAPSFWCHGSFKHACAYDSTLHMCCVERNV